MMMNWTVTASHSLPQGRASDGTKFRVMRIHLVWQIKLGQNKCTTKYASKYSDLSKNEKCTEARSVFLPSFVIRLIYLYSLKHMYVTVLLVYQNNCTKFYFYWSLVFKTHSLLVLSRALLESKSRAISTFNYYLLSRVWCHLRCLASHRCSLRETLI